MEKQASSLGAIEILELVFVYLAEVSSLKDYDHILGVLANMGRALTSADRCSIWIVSEDKQTIWTKVAQGMDKITLSINSGIVGDAIISGEREIIDDVYSDDRFNHYIDKKTGYKTSSMMVIPMYDYNENIIGAFQVINHKGKSKVFDSRDLERLTLASTYAAETLISAQLAEEIEATQKEVVLTMGSIGESRSKETGNHVKRVAEYSKILALEYGLPEEVAELLKQASPMHDIGKIAIPDAILNKPGRFNAKERKIMDEHAKLGHDMIKDSKRPLLQAAAIVSCEHHEKWDGTGYPNALSGEDIHIYGRITALADVFDALGSDRVYKKAWSDEKILKLFKEERGKHFDPKLVDIFFEKLDKFYEVRKRFKDKYLEKVEEEIDLTNNIKVLGAFGTKIKGYGTSSFLLNETNTIDAGNLLVGLDENSAKLENIWITHSHLDHISDIAYIVDNYFSSIQKSINICALPQTIKAIKKHFFNDVIWPDFSKIDLSHGSGKCINYIEIELDKEYPLNQVESIKAFRTDHTVPSCGFIYKKDETAVLITADTYELDNVIDILESDLSIKSMVLECSFPSSMQDLAIESKHLTPKLLLKSLQTLQREDIQLYINHVKPLYFEEISKEIESSFIKYSPIIVKDGEIINF